MRSSWGARIRIGGRFRNTESGIRRANAISGPLERLDEEDPVGFQRFEDLPVWNDAIELAVRLVRISQAGRLNGVGDLKSQLERAAISISNNIAEGYERGTSEELITFLYFSRGSTGEVRSMIHLLGRLPHFKELAPQLEDLRLRTESISRQLGGWIESIKNSSYKGHRSQNDRTREAAQAMKRRDQFVEKVREVQDDAIRRQRSSPAEDSGPE
jgi:four helix bundle protein